MVTGRIQQREIFFSFVSKIFFLVNNELSTKRHLNPNMVSLLVCVVGILLFIPIKSNSINQIPEFDVTTEENISHGNIVHEAGTYAQNLGGKLETNLGRTYEFLGHSMCLFS